MPGHNHYADCDCGWCVKSRTSVPLYSSHTTRPTFGTFDTYVNPNARCPVCGHPVFFYQSAYGGRVFFNELGPPWPKHGCTDKEPWRPVPLFVEPMPRIAPPPWKSAGWLPLNISRAYREGDWWVVSAKVVENDEAIRLLVHGKPSVEEGALAAFTGFNSAGVTIVSYLCKHGEVSASNLAYRYTDYVFVNPDELIVRLKNLLDEGVV